MKRTEVVLSKLLKGATAGAIGGLLGSWCMSLFAGAFDRLVLKERPRPFLVKGSKLAMNASPQEWDSTVVVASEFSRRVLGRELTRQQRALGATAVHYAMGAGLGAAYGAANEVAPITKAGAGLGFGIGLWLVAFEYLMPKFGLTRHREEYSKAMHADSAGEHVVFGMTTELVRSAIRRQL
ncbi:MAG TPA: DUF1440 domain-containing protein [Terriglobales bacterium]|nr:DUF1440 domain-containing protein [Terriglobales bacterium]